ncbi:hypothetical protein L1049_022977 [Liquidambar formosana]|uniref:Uncharacterized protein n=1 Tax=Liquidambar formosana TaxID=63359 RepID=A0AAP0WPM7_LIQFO
MERENEEKEVKERVFLSILLLDRGIYIYVIYIFIYRWSNVLYMISFTKRAFSSSLAGKSWRFSWSNKKPICLFHKKQLKVEREGQNYLTHSGITSVSISLTNVHFPYHRLSLFFSF